MENKKKLDELKDEAKESLKKDEPAKKEEVEDFWDRFKKLEKIYKDNFDRLIAAELLDIKMLLFEIEEKHKEKEEHEKEEKDKK
ncbi:MULTISPECIES: hypothetical protein [Cetobacterium]|uniref:Uncharacterized protein n=2 Tax=Cetobacterium TaxID=180162 RepID=U7VBQ3_9FUSO|nr:hypothetical protein [Cetobacterium somerae]ERT68946.1 hypothetical protein HMPREF0202_01189 [Cetobacterium somerae ATCC BAA-474]MCQ9626368.1 hypothetical protein [Cetobacterium somerae]